MRFIHRRVLTSSVTNKYIIITKIIFPSVQPKSGVVAPKRGSQGTLTHCSVSNATYVQIESLPSKCRIPLSTHQVPRCVLPTYGITFAGEKRV